MIDFLKLDYREFEILIGLLLKHEGYQIIREPGPPGVAGPDYEVISPNQVAVLVEVKHFKRPAIGRKLIEQFAGDLERYRLQKPSARGLIVLSSPLELGEAMKAADSLQHIDVWDGLIVGELVKRHSDLESLFLATIEAKTQFKEHVQKAFAAQTSRATELSTALSSITCGRKNWKDYERVCTEILTYIFTPDLAPPDIQSRSDDGLDIIDAIFPIRSTQPPWGLVRAEYRSRFVVAEFKNHCGPIGQVEVESIAQYLWQPAQRFFGLLVSRVRPSANALAQRRRKWLDEHKCIVILTDEDLQEMLQLKEANAQPFQVIDAHLEDFFRTLTP